MKKSVFFCAFYSFVLMSNALIAKEPLSDKPHTVVVILEAKQGKEGLLKSALALIAQLSRHEESCIEYRVCQDKENPGRFALFEQWKSKELHQKQFTKPYITNFIEQSASWLDKPYDAVFGQEISSP